MQAAIDRTASTGDFPVATTECISSETVDELNPRAMSARLLAIKKAKTGNYKQIGRETGVHRTRISLLANHATPLKEHEARKVVAWLNVHDQEHGIATRIDTASDTRATTDQTPGHAPARNMEQMFAPSTATSRDPEHITIPLYPTTDFRAMMAWCAEVHSEREISAITGEPGTGKTTALKTYMEQNPNARYIDCWPTMKCGDLLDAIAEALGITIRGTVHKRTQVLLRHLQANQEIMLLFDEAEKLKNWNVKSLDTIRKLCENAGIAVIFAGTTDLEEVLKRGTGRENCSYLYSRITKCKTNGIGESDVAAMLAAYHMEPGAKRKLIEMAVDVKKGGLRNFIIVLRKCLKLADGGQVTTAIVKSAMSYKLLW